MEESMNQLQLKPPIAKREDKRLTIHGHTRIDPYYWLQDKDNPEVMAYLKAENAYCEAMMADLTELQATLYQEMVSRIKESDDTESVRKGNYDYYSRTEAGKQYPLYCRRRRRLAGGELGEQILLDLNTYAYDNAYEYLTLGIYKISPDHKLLAYGLDTTGAELFTIRFKNLETGEDVGDVIEKASYSAEWADSTIFFYTTEQERIGNIDKAYRRIVGSTQADQLIYHELDGRYDVGISMTKDGCYLMIGPTDLATFEYCECYFLATDQPLAALKPIQLREEGLRYTVSHRDGLFYIITNADGATNNKLMTAPVSSPNRSHWQELIGHREAVKLNGLDLFADHLVRYERENGLPTIHISRFSSGESHPITFPEAVYCYKEKKNPEFHSTVLRFSYTSLVTPECVIDYDMNTRQQVVKKQQSVLGGYEPANYITERIFATAVDGARVPISLVYRRGAWDGTPTALHLYGYGCYGDIVEPQFNAARLSLLDRGVIFAIAHVRGSQTMGRKWYDDGKLLNKKNTFTDFVACAKHLIAQGYTAPERLSAQGSSAGGLLIGAVLNLTHSLFTTAIATVPAADLLTVMLNENLHLTVAHYDEFGNPKDEETYWYMLDYSPYEQVTAKAYPHILVETTLNDPHVPYWQPAKWVAKLRSLKTNNNTLLLRTNMQTGHEGSSGRYDRLKDQARRFAFILDKFGLGT